MPAPPAPYVDSLTASVTYQSSVIDALPPLEFIYFTLEVRKR